MKFLKIQNILFLVALLGTGLAQAQSFQYINTVPSSGKLKKIASSAFNSSGALFLSDVSSASVMVYDSTGTQIEMITSMVSGPVSVNLKNPAYIYVDHKDNLYVCDISLGKVFVRNTDGTGLNFGEKGSGQGMIGQVGGMAVDYDGYIYLLNLDRNQIDIYSPEGNFLTWVQSDVSSFVKPIAIGINSKNELYVLDSEGPSVFIYDVNGALVNTHRNLTRKQGILVSKLVSMAVLPNGDFLVADAASCSISHIDNLGVVQGTVGSKGKSAKGIFEDVSNIAVGGNARSNFAIIDGSVNQAQLFDLNSLSAATPRGSKRMQLELLSGAKTPIWDMAVSSGGDRYVIPCNNRQQVIIYRKNKDNEFSTLGTKFGDATAIAIDRNNNILVVDRKNKEVIMCDSNGVFLRRFGKDIDPKLKDPVSIAIQ